VIWLALWAVATFGKVRMKRLTPWLIALLVLSFPTYLALDLSGDRKFWRLISEATFYTCWVTLLWIQRWSLFESISLPSAKWYTPWRVARFSMRNGAIIRVQAIDSASRWYSAKLGLERQTADLISRPDFAKLAFKQDGHSVVLVTTEALTSERRRILFTRNIEKMKEVLVARGLQVPPIERDRQGTPFFEVYDPDGNEIEVVQAS